MAIQFDHTANGLVTITTTNAASPSPYTLRLPDGTGSNGQVLTTDGTGNLSFETAVTTYGGLTTKPAVNVIFTGDVTGAGNVLLENTSTNTLSIALSTAVPAAFRYCNGNTITACGITQHTAINTNAFNFFAGQCAGNAITTGGNNIGFGFEAGRDLTSGSFNFFAGACAGRLATTAQNNIAIGCRAAALLTTGVGGIFIGPLAGNKNSIGQQNIFLGSSAGGNNTSGSYNTFFGLDAGCYITTGSRNFFAGACSGANITVGNDNIILGCVSSCHGFTGSTSNVIVFATGGNVRFKIDVLENVFLGQCAGGCAKTTGRNNNFFGCHAGLYNTTGSENNFLGRSAGISNTSGCNNNFLGRSSGLGNTTGCNNNFFGCAAGGNNQTGSNNTAMGYYAGYANNSGGHNFFAGFCAGRYNTANHNIFIGCEAGLFNSTGVDNVFIGRKAGSAETGFESFGSRNFFVGVGAGGNITSGSDNIIFGNITNNVGLTTSTSNTIIFASGGIRRFVNEGVLGNTTITGNIISTNTFFGNGRGLVGIVLGTNTDGNYTTRVVGGTGINATGTADEGNVITVGLTNTGVTATTYGNATIIPVISVDAQGRITSASNVAVNISGASLSGIVLGTNTDGNYVASVSAGLGVTVTGGTGEGATPTIAANVRSVGTFTGDVSNTQLLSSILQVDGSGSNLDADLLDGQQGAYYLNYNNLTNDPAANIALTGDVTGAANAILLANSTIFGITTTLVNSGVTAGSYGNANAVPQITVDAKGRVTAASNLLIDRNYGLITNKPSVNVTFTGDVTGIANVNLANENTNSVSVALTIASNSVALGTDTTGNYVANVIAGAGIVASGGGSETSTVTISHLDTSSVGNVSSDNSNGVVIQDITLGFDTFGHVTGASVATVDLDTRYLRTSGATQQTVQGNVIFEGNVEFLGNVVTISANNLIVSDNFIYLNDGNNNINIDFGFVGNYNDGVYRHAGFFRDATDGYFKVFDNYAPEPDAGVDIDTGNVTYREANFKANIFLGNRLDVGSISGNSIVASANIFTAGNLIVGQAVRTSGGALFWNSGNDGTGSGLDADLLDGQNGTYYLDYTNVTQKPAANIALTGDVTGSANAILTAANSTILSIAATLASTGVSATTYGNAKIIPRFTVDAKGRLTNAANVAIALDYADLVTKPSINLTFTGGATGSGNLLIANSTNSLSVALSLVEADTLATVTGRGATTATAVTFTNATEATSNSSGAVQVTGGLGVSGNIYGGRVIVTGRSHAANVGLNSAIIGGSINTNAGANSFIGGGIRNVVLSQQSGIVAGTSNRITGASSSNSVILGGGCNLITSSADSTILGSKNTTIDSVSQGFSIASTTGSHAAGTQTGEIASCGATASGTRTVLIGTKDSLFGAFAQNSAILGVDGASIYCKNSVIAGGAGHDIFADNSVILGGAKGCGDVRGKVIMPGHAWTIWTDLGSAQVGKQTLVNQTSTSAGSNVLINGSGAADFTNSIGIRNNHVYVVKGTITAANATGTTKVWDYTTSAKANATGTITFVGNYGTGNAIINTIAADPGTDTWAVRFVSGKSGTEGWITANVTGNTSTIRWLLTSETSELKFA